MSTDEPETPPSATPTPSASDIEEAAGRVIELTNTLGATAADLQAAGNAVRAARELARAVSRRPEHLAIAGVGMIVAAGILALRRDRLGEDPGAPAPTQSQQQS